MNSFKKGLVTKMKATAALAAASAGGFWDGTADEGTPFPYTVFQILDQEPIYGFGARVGWRLLVMIKVFGRDAADGSATGGELTDAGFDAVIAMSDDDESPALAVAGYSVECFQFQRLIPTPSYSDPETSERGAVTHQKAGLFEVVLTPA